MNQFKEVRISEIFSLERGKSLYTRQYGNDHKGEFPVFSAGKEKLTAIDTFDFDGEYLTWATNGFAGYLKKIKGRFSINSDRGIFIPKIQKIDIDFIKYSIQWDLRNLTKGRMGDRGKNEFTKLSPDKIKDNIFIKIPTKENGEFDLEKQKEIASKYEKIEKIKDRVRIMKEEFEDQIVSLEDIYIGIDKSIIDLFTIRQGDAFYTKKRILENNWIGDIPVYSSNTKEEGLLVGIQKEFIKEKDLYYQNCLTWAIDGYAGKIFSRNIDNLENKKEDRYLFSINNHCGILLPKLDNLYLPFIQILLQSKFFIKAKGYGNNKLGTNQIEDIFIKIPIKENGEFNLEKQQVIAAKYEKIEKIQRSLIEELKYLEKVGVDL